MRRFLFAVIQIRAGECLLHADHIVVNGLAAADVAYFHMIGAFCLYDLGNLLGVLIAHVTAGNDGDEDNKPEDNSMKIKITVGNREVTATMKDNVTARDFLSRLPIEVTMNDYAGAEKIFYPEPAFNTEGAPKGHTPSRGDIDLYAPWGNVALFYKSGSHSSELIHLGRIDGNGIEAFDVAGNVVVKIERQ